jgi:hypothetical protein
VNVADGNEEVAKELWEVYTLHKMGNHQYCVNETIGMSSIGNASYAIEAEKGVEQSVKSQKVMEIFTEYIEQPKILNIFATVDPNVNTSVNETIHNLFNTYHDKTKHYKYYDILYQMAYLDYNENRGREVKYKYTTSHREWKKNHKYRTNRQVLEEKTYYW